MSRPLTLAALLVVLPGVQRCAAEPPGEPDSALPVDPAAERELLELGGPGLTVRRTDHFLIAYDTSKESVTALVSRLEATHRAVYRFCRINELPAQPLRRRLQILFFESPEQYAEVARAARFNSNGSAGFYSQRTNVATFFNILNAPELRDINRRIQQLESAIESLRKAKPVDRDAVRAKARERSSMINVRDRVVERINRTTVQHETAHQLFFNAGVHVRGAQNPDWLVEGLACLFETPPSQSGAGAGTVNQARLSDFRSCLGNGNPKANLKAKDLEVALSSGKFVPLRTLIGDTSLFLRRNDPNLVHYYSQAWALVCYLQRAKRDELADYLRLLGQRPVGLEISSEQEIADFESVFGPLDERFQRRWVAYILVNLRFKPSELQ
jgi:hypothetical protein